MYRDAFAETAVASLVGSIMRRITELWGGLASLYQDAYANSALATAVPWLWEQMTAIRTGALTCLRLDRLAEAGCSVSSISPWLSHGCFHSEVDSSDEESEDTSGLRDCEKDATSL